MSLPKVKLKSNTLKNIKLQPYRIDCGYDWNNASFKFALDKINRTDLNLSGNAFYLIIGGDQIGQFIITAYSFDFSMMQGQIRLERLV